MAPYFHDDVTWQSGVMRLEGIDIFIAANNQAWQTLGYPAVRDVEIDAGEDFAVVGYTLAGTHELPMMGQAATGKPIAMPALLVFRLRDGRIAHLRTMTDNAGAMRISANAG
jgi:ketosteroid isomerase-like protein